MAIFALPAESFPSFSKISKHTGWKLDGIRVHMQVGIHQKRNKIRYRIIRKTKVWWQK